MGTSRDIHPTGRPASGADGLLDTDPAAYHARMSPNRTACIEAATGVRLTYKDLNERVGRCAGLLVELLSQPIGERVAVLGRNSLEQVVLGLACQRAGAILQPLNWRLKAVELAALVADATPRVLVYEAEFEAEAHEAALAAPDVVLIPMLGAEGLSARIDASGSAPPAVVAPDAPCILLYTSGTTGRPKGVIITRRGAFFSALNFAFVGQIDTSSVTLCDVPMFHTIGLVAVTRTTLTMGATLVISDRFIPARALERLSDPALGVTHFFGVPQIAAALREDPAYARADLSRLKAIFTGGAPLPTSLIDDFLARGVLLVNGFGMSEAGTILHMPIDPEATRRNPGCVGYPAPFMEVRIVDEGVDVEPGRDGELWLRGPAVTPGYWNQPAATEAAFHDDWFRTGDAGRQEPEGVIRLIDRRKDMYITGGENVYPAEVEAALLTHAQVLDAAVIGAPDPRWGESGVAFVVLRNGAVCDADEIFSHCDARLARYKRPVQLRFVSEVPRNAAGKIRKDVLRRLHAEADTPPASTPNARPSPGPGDPR